MSASFTCDGCRSSVDVPTVVGVVLKRDYCDECAKKAKQFSEAEEALRKTMHERFVTDRDLLIATYSEGGFKLPDVPHAT